MKLPQTKEDYLQAAMDYIESKPYAERQTIIYFLLEELLEHGLINIHSSGDITWPASGEGLMEQE